MSLFSHVLVTVMSGALAWSAVEDRPAKSRFDSKKAVELWWTQMVADQNDSTKNLPRAVAETLVKVAPAFVAVPGLGKIIEGDLNCDGAIDYVVTGLAQDHRLVQALRNKNKPSFARLKSVHVEYLKYRYELMPQIWMGLSRQPNGWSWTIQKSREIPNATKECGAIAPESPPAQRR